MSYGKPLKLRSRHLKGTHYYKIGVIDGFYDVYILFAPTLQSNLEGSDNDDEDENLQYAIPRSALTRDLINLNEAQRTHVLQMFANAFDRYLYEKPPVYTDSAYCLYIQSHQIILVSFVSVYTDKYTAKHILFNRTSVYTENCM